MSATSDHLIETVEAVMAARGIPVSDVDAFEEIQHAIMLGGVTGYVCKTCGGPSPVGVGFAVDWDYAGPNMPRISVSVCPCGMSELAEGVTV